MKPLTLALIAAGAAALLIVAGRRPAATAATSPIVNRVASVVEPIAVDFGNWLRRIDPRSDPAAPGDSTIYRPDLYYDTMMDRWDYPAVGRAIYNWGAGEGW